MNYLIFTKKIAPELRLAGKVFLFATMFGIGIAILTVKSSDQLEKFLLSIYSDVLKDIDSDSFMSYFSAIFQRNLTVASFLIILGFIHRYLTLGIIIINGGVLGFVSYAIVMYAGGLTQLSMIIPHGIFEIPATLIAGAVGISIGKQKGIKKKLDQLKTLFNIVLIIFYLLLIAGIIEAVTIVKT